MGYTNKITCRNVFVDRLTVGEVATFCGVNPRTVKRRALGIGGINSSGYHIYTIVDALSIFTLVNDRKARGSELSLLLMDMGMKDVEEVGGFVLKMYVRQLVENQDIRDQDIL